MASLKIGRPIGGNHSLIRMGPNLDRDHHLQIKGNLFSKHFFSYNIVKLSKEKSVFLEIMNLQPKNFNVQPIVLKARFRFVRAHLNLQFPQLIQRLR